MAYRLIETITQQGRKRVQWKSTGHNGDQEQRERQKKRQAALALLNKSRNPKHLGKAGSK